jgi:hypothetical protein
MRRKSTNGGHFCHRKISSPMSFPAAKMNQDSQPLRRYFGPSAPLVTTGVSKPGVRCLEIFMGTVELKALAGTCFKTDGSGKGPAEGAPALCRCRDNVRP